MEQFNPIIATERQQTINGVQGRYTGATMRHDEKPGCFCKQTWVTSKLIGDGERFSVEIEYDDNCRNGHNTFTITGELRRFGGMQACGCLHEDITKHFPKLAPLIKWHLFDSTGPMHYVANTLYHADEHGPNKAWIYYTSPCDPLKLGKEGETLLVYTGEEDARRAEGTPGYRVQWDEKTAKVKNLDYARSSAVWPEATDEQLSLPREELKALLEARLPALLLEFRAAVESCGFLFTRE